MQLFQPDNFSDPVVTYSSLDHTDKRIAQIFSRYFGQCDIILVEELNRAAINSRNFKVTARIDGKRCTFLLRQYKGLTHKKQIEFYLGLLTDLHDRGISVSVPVKTKTSRYTTSIGGEIYSLFHFVRGRHFSPTKAGLVSVAAAVAQMHLVFQRLDSVYHARIKKFSKKGHAYFNVIQKYSLNDFERIYEKVARKKNKTATDRLVLRARDVVWGAYRDVERFDVKVKSQIIHSDLHPHNILMDNARVAAILDIDTVRISEQPRDAASALYRFGRQFFIGKSDADAQKRAPQIRNYFIEAYTAINPLSSDEVYAMPFLLKDEFLCKLLFVLRLVYEEGNMAWRRDLPKFIASLEEINYFWPEVYEK